jgi:hypothetical protein
MKRSSILLLLLLHLSHSDSEAFHAQSPRAIRPSTVFRIGRRPEDDVHVSFLKAVGNNNDWDREIDEKVMRRLQREGKPTGGMGETAAGAVLGGLLMGPFGTCRTR